MSKTLFFHGSTSDGYRFTTAGIPVTGRDKDMKIAIAVCSKQDAFVKATGREYVLDRVILDHSTLKNKITVEVPSPGRGKKFVELCADLQNLKRNTLFTLFHYPLKK